ncbi:MAG: OPT/YSL family transporter [Bacillota bacterium]
MSTEVKTPLGPKSHPKALTGVNLILGLAMAAVSGAICMQIIGRIGITPNTSIIGAIVAITLARVVASLRPLDSQNIIQTYTSAGGFSAANAGLLSVAIVFLMGQPALVYPLLIGSGIGVLLDVWFVTQLYNTKVYPAEGAWPPGVATAEALWAADEGGKRARRLVEGIIAGIIGTYFKLPMAGIGIAFIANIFAITALGIGLLIRGYAPVLFGVNLGETYVPHGMMIGAGLVQLVQAFLIISRKQEEKETAQTEANEGIPKKIVIHFALFSVGALVMALIAGALWQMSLGQIIVFTLFAGFAAAASTIIVGLCAMHSGWFPAFAVTIIFLTIGMFLGIPAVPLALLTGYTASTGPLFADFGYDLKTGWLIRGRGQDMAYEKDGRKQQFIAEAVGGIMGLVMVGLFAGMHFKLDLLPPVSRVFAATINAGADPGIVRQLILWSIPGAAIQVIGGPGRAMGVLFATGLLIMSPIYGWGLIAAVIARRIIGEEPMKVREAGLIAGDGIYGFVNSIIRTFFA